ncbi:MAG: hypothetical protein M1827_002913 [Pycnora praestabilis]|nr:MAG: hypothetical protein M1827_002913 [Pycnora praestabilis]
MQRFGLFDLPLGLLAILATPVTANLPYNPTRAFLSPKYNGGLAYIISPTSTIPSSYQLLSINTSSTLNAASLPYTTLAASPFTNSQSDAAFTPVIDDQGEISVYAGSCSLGSNGSSLWRFSPDLNLDDGNGTWSRQGLKGEGLDGNDILSGANYLSSGVSFSTTVGGDANESTVYLFGGMCPTAGSPADSWTSAANYSNSMLTLKPSGSTSAPSYSSITYTLDLSAGRGPPIPEAGFSVTPLPPSILNSSGGTQSQQQNFVLLGGHTETAFINMSQLALFSLPEETWSFPTINMPVANAKTDLTARGDTAMINPRSGHTSVLTGDGKRLVVFGGWVGDVNTPADPQLLVLEVAEAYGGTGDWTWSIPTQAGTGLQTGTGIYGHGAVMLPGDVMMVVGGYIISETQGSRTKRADQTLNTQNLLLNTTSNTWLSNYSSPSIASGSTPGKPNASSSSSPSSKSSDESDSGSSSSSQRAGLGAGLALGFAALFGAVVIYFWYSRRLRRRREAHEKELHEFSLSAQRFHADGLNLDGIDGRGGEKSAMEWMGERHRNPRDSAYPWGPGPSSGGFREGSGWRHNGGSEAERTGLLLEIPSPTRGLRKSLHGRGNHHTAPRYDDVRRSHGSGNIHPIDERDEYEGTVSAQSETVEHSDINVFSSAPILNPFRDPNPLRSHPIAGGTSPTSPAHEREVEIQNWVSDWAAADALMKNPTRTPSPDKDRTSSTLSEQSARSNISARSQAQVSEGLSRSLSQRSAAIFSSSNPFSSQNTSPTFDYPGGRRSPPNPTYRRSQSLTTFPTRPGTSDTFATAGTSFPQLQTEGEALLGGRPDHSAPESPTKIRKGAGGWMGSMRRAFGGERSTSPSSNGDRSTPSPNKYHEDAGLPRRAASASAMLWRKKQGAADWDSGGVGASGGGTVAAAGGVGEDEWDVERAIEGRVVQVMFTVPREKLRVVNGECDRLSVSDVEDNVGERELEGYEGKGKEVMRESG